METLKFTISYQFWMAAAYSVYVYICINTSREIRITRVIDKMTEEMQRLRALVGTIMEQPMFYWLLSILEEERT